MAMLNNQRVPLIILFANWRKSSNEVGSMQVLTVDSAGQIRRELQPLEALVLARETQGNGNGWGERCLFCYDNYNGS